MLMYKFTGKLWALFTILCGLSVNTWGQPLLVELSFKYSPQTEELSAQALYPVGKFKAGDSLKLSFLGGSVYEVQHLQGRVKSTLNFQQSGNEIWIELPQNLHVQSEINILYRLPLNEMATSPYLQLLKEGFVVNALNMADEGEFGLPGFFYPVVDNKPHHLRMNLTLPRGLNFSAPGVLQYKVNHNQQISYFTQTEGIINPSAFFLLIGNFEEDDPEDIIEEYEINTLSPEELAVRKIREGVQPALDFFSDQTGFLFLDENVLQLEEMAEDEMPRFFLKREDFQDNPPSDKIWQLVKAAAFVSTEENLDSASHLHYHFYVNQRGEDWKQKVLENRLARYSEQGDFFWQQYLQMFLKVRGINGKLADTTSLTQFSGRAETRTQAYLSIARELYRLRKPIEVELRYRYSQADSALYLYLSQPDTNLQCNIPLQGNIFGNDTGAARQVERFAYLRTHDTLKIALAGSPKSAHFSTDTSPILKLTEHRPQTYLLFELTQTEKPKLQQRALEELLETASANLFTTVMGIALDADNVNLQLKALENAEKLDAAGQRKLRETFKELALSANQEEVRTKAQSLVERFYK